MEKYHINGNGEARKCVAQIRCDFGGVSEHYPTAEKARQAFESQMESESIPEAQSFSQKDFQKPADIVGATVRAASTAAYGPQERVSIREALDERAFRRLSES